jgi:hypothetical protein
MDAFCTSEPETTIKGRFAFLIYLHYLSKFYQLFNTLGVILKKVGLTIVYNLVNDGYYFLYYKINITLSTMLLASNSRCSFISSNDRITTCLDMVRGS